MVALCVCLCGTGVKSLPAERTEKNQPDVSLSMPNLYPDGHGIKPKMVRDLQKMLLYMPEEHRSFYENMQEYDNDGSGSEYGD